MSGRRVDEATLARYFDLAERAVETVRDGGFDEERVDEAEDVLELAQRYVDDARHWRDEEEHVLAYGSLNFAHGLLDAGVRSGLFDVHDPELFTQD